MNPLVYLLYLAVTIYAWMIVARALLSWFQLRPGGVAWRIYGVLHEVTEPYLSLFRRILPVGRLGGVGIDFSAIVAIVVLFLLLQVIQRL
jgi:YggT family protein